MASKAASLSTLDSKPRNSAFAKAELSKSKLFQLPQSKDGDNPLVTREKFAVSLRKEKKQKILEIRRKKTYEGLGLDIASTKQQELERVMECIPEHMRTGRGMETAIEQVPGLIKEPVKHQHLLQIMTGFRAVSVHADGPAYDVMVTHQHLLKYLVDVLDLPVKSYPTP